MHSFNRGIAAAAIAFAASLVGMWLQHAVSDPILIDAKSTVGSMVGLFTLLLALVLGLLVWTAFAVYTTQQSEALSLGPIVAEIDVTMTEYGRDCSGGRARLIDALDRAHARFFGDRTHGPEAFTFEETWETLAGMDSYFDSLDPTTDRQKRLLQLARDRARQLADTQMLMARQLFNPLPPFLLIIVVLWAAALFLGNDLVAKINVVSVASHLVGGRRGRQRHLPHPRIEFALYRRGPPVLGRRRPPAGDPESEAGRRESRTGFGRSRSLKRPATDGQWRG